MKRACAADLAAAALLTCLSGCGGGGDGALPAVVSSASSAPSAPVLTNCSSVVTSPPVAANAVLSAFVGVPYAAGNADGVGAAASFNQPSGIVSDSDGTLYVHDGNGLRRVSIAGAVTTLYSSAGAGRATGLARDVAGNFYFPEGHAILRLTPSGSVTTFAGDVGSYGNVDGTGALARLNGPLGVEFDRAGTLYVTDSGNDSVRRITPDGTVTTFVDGTTTTPTLRTLAGLAIDGAGTVYVIDASRPAIFRITPSAAVSVWAGDPAVKGSTDGGGGVARFIQPRGLATDPAGNVYVADTGAGNIRRITPAGLVSTLPGSTGFVAVDKLPYSYADDLALDGSGNIFVSDTVLQIVRRLTPAGTATTLAGAAVLPGHVDGTGANVRFNFPSSIASDGQHTLYVAEGANYAIRTVSPSGSVSTRDTGLSLPGHLVADRVGTLYATMVVLFAHIASVQRFMPDGSSTTVVVGEYHPGAVDPEGTLYVTSYYDVAKITAAGAVSVLAGSSTNDLEGLGSADGTGSEAHFNLLPGGLALDAACNVYVADTNNHTIRRITPTGTVTTVAGMAGFAGSTDGVGSAARFNLPTDVAVDTAGNVYVNDQGNATLRRIAPDGRVTTLAGTPGVRGFQPGTLPGVLAPTGLTLDGGAMYIVNGNGIVRIGPP